jgi:hypothetical protein
LALRVLEFCDTDVRATRLATIRRTTVETFDSSGCWPTGQLRADAGRPVRPAARIQLQRVQTGVRAARTINSDPLSAATIVRRRAIGRARVSPEYGLTWRAEYRVQAGTHLSRIASSPTRSQATMRSGGGRRQSTAFLHPARTTGSGDDSSIRPRSVRLPRQGGPGDVDPTVDVLHQSAHKRVVVLGDECRVRADRFRLT